MTNKIKAAICTLVILIVLSFLSVGITWYPKTAVYVFVASIFAIAILMIYYVILKHLED
jgi:hypothetical protein